MKIEKIVYKDNNGAQITFEGGLCLVVDALKLYGMHLENGMDLDDDTVEQLRQQARLFTALTKAAGSLSRADFSRKGLVKRLKEKGVDRDAANEAADFFEKKGYVNDEAFARKICRVYTNEKHFGRRRVIDEMAKRGITGELARTAADEICDDESNIKIYFEKKYSGLDLTDRKMKTRVVNALTRAGYTWGDISHVLSCDEE